jgi:hypothetical protein
VMRNHPPRRVRPVLHVLPVLHVRPGIDVLDGDVVAPHDFVRDGDEDLEPGSVLEGDLVVARGEVMVMRASTSLPRS